MNNKAFTLIELLGVMAILAVLALVAVPAINVSLSKGRTKLSSVQEKQIIKAAHDYYAEHLSELPEIENENEIKIEKLNNEGYLKEMPKDPKTGEEYNNICVSVKKEQSNYKYETKQCNTPNEETE